MRVSKNGVTRTAKAYRWKHYKRAGWTLEAATVSELPEIKVSEALEYISQNPQKKLRLEDIINDFQYTQPKEVLGAPKQLDTTSICVVDDTIESGDTPPIVVVPDGTPLGELTVAQLKEKADALGIQYNSKITKDELINLLV